MFNGQRVNKGRAWNGGGYMGGYMGDLFEGYSPHSTYLRWGRQAGPSVVDQQLQTRKQTRVKKTERNIKQRHKKPKSRTSYM